MRWSYRITESRTDGQIECDYCGRKAEDVLGTVMGDEVAWQIGDEGWGRAHTACYCMCGNVEMEVIICPDCFIKLFGEKVKEVEQKRKEEDEI